jgi:DNA repair exonuclease SbcCD nuclease subunit
MTPEDDVIFKFLHTADWHLGKRFERFGHLENNLTRARLDVLDRVFGMADRYAVDAVFCAGDLFDDPFPKREWWEALVKKLQNRSWVNRPVFLLPGNHDPLIPESIWQNFEFREALPAGVHIVGAPTVDARNGVFQSGDQDLCTFELRSDVMLFAVPCRSRAGQKDPCQSIPVREEKDHRVRIGLVHGSTFDWGRDWQVNFPIGRDSAVERGLDYLAIGDTHSFRYVPPDRLKPPTIYPGAPEPTAFDEADAGHVAIGFVTRSRDIRVQKERVAAWTWEAIAVKSFNDLSKLRDRQDLHNRVLQLDLDMYLPATEYEAAQRILKEFVGTSAVHARVGVLELAGAGLTLDTSNIDAALQDLPDVLRAAVQRLKEAETQAENPEVPRRALYELYRLTRKAS